MYRLNNNFELHSLHVKIGDWNRKRGRHHCWPINPPPFQKLLDPPLHTAYSSNGWQKAKRV